MYINETLAQNYFVRSFHSGEFCAHKQKQVKKDRMLNQRENLIKTSTSETPELEENYFNLKQIKNPKSQHCNTIGIWNFKFLGFIINWLLH